MPKTINIIRLCKVEEMVMRYILGIIDPLCEEMRTSAGNIFGSLESKYIRVSFCR